jgi:hypothetical protein
VSDEQSSGFETFIGFFVLLCFDGLLTLVFRACAWPVAFGIALAVFVGLFLIGLGALFTSDEPVVILSQLPDDLREPLRPFTRRGAETLRASEIRQFYRASAELIEDRTNLARHQAELVNATTGLELATAVADFLNHMSPEERALLEYHRRDR